MTLVAGVDIGSTTAKVVLLEDGKPVASAITPTGADCEAAAKKSLAIALANTKKSQEDIKYIVATGYGRRAIDFGNETITEISANAKGAIYLGSQKGQVKSIIDVGGQDTKAIILDDKGRITNFIMNDKCAAGTGRFIEVMAKALNVELDKIGDISLQHKKEVTISSICTVFAESEVISLVSAGEELEDILYGIHKAIADRTMGLINRLGGVSPDVIMAGGVAKNIGVVKALEKVLGTPIKIHVEPQIIGALGAAILSLEKAS